MDFIVSNSNKWNNYWAFLKLERPTKSFSSYWGFALILEALVTTTTVEFLIPHLRNSGKRVSGKTVEMNLDEFSKAFIIDKTF